MVHLFGYVGLYWGVVVTLIDPWVIDKYIEGRSLEWVSDKKLAQ
jgi:hypothetical protein